MRLTTQSFRGMAPRITPRALPENASQEAINARLVTGDLGPWKRPALVEALANSGVVRSIFPFEDIWLSYAQEVEFARGAVIDDDAEARVYITGLDAPRFTTYALATATGGSPPYPAETRLLGVPAPSAEPSVTVTVAPPDESNITLTNPGAEAGNTSGWTIDSGGLVAIENGDIPGLDAQAGSWFFGGGAAAATEGHQDVNLSSLGVIAGQGLQLTWWQANGANESLAAMAIEFLDSLGQTLSEVSATQIEVGSVNTWVQRTLTTQVPDGAVTARLKQLYTLVGVGDIDSYIDTIAISSIAYTNAFDGSSLAGWTVSPNDGSTSGNLFRRVEIDNDDGWPPPSFRMRGDSRVPFFFRDFSTDRSPSVTLQFDYLELLSRSNCGLHVVLFGSAGGVATGVYLSASAGVWLATHPQWASLGAQVQNLAPAGTVDANTRYTVTIVGTQLSETAANVSVTIRNAETGELVLDGATGEVSIDGPNIGFKAATNFNDRRFYVDNIAVTVAAPNPTQGGSAATIYTSYVYTFVNEFGEEGPPSDPSDTVQRNANATTIVTTPTALPTGVSEDYGITTKAIYRAVTGALGTVFRFVGEIPLEQADFEDTVADADLGDPLESEEWDLPPSDLRYILALPNGIMVGASANRLCFSVQNRPHAWPVAWRLAIDSTITGLGNVDTSVVVGSETFVYTASGNSPDAYSMSKPVAPHSCQSARSVAFVTGIGVVFAGPDGLMAVSGPNEVRNLTEMIFTREQWQALNPSLMTGIAHDDVYYFFSDVRAGEAMSLEYVGASEQQFTVPDDWHTMLVKGWGAGGAGNSGNNLELFPASGGGGGYAESLLDVEPGEELTAIVGQGGLVRVESAEASRAYGGGAEGGYSGEFVASENRRVAGGGGGRSAIRRDGVELWTAAGGGGAGTAACQGGPGGGFTGETGQGGGSGGGGGGGEQDDGGAGGTWSGGQSSTPGDDGGQYEGGHGASFGAGAPTDFDNAGGGGGGGYYGGGGGAGGDLVGGGGGGGSSFAGFTESGSLDQPGNPDDSDRPVGVGVGGPPATEGGNGFILISPAAGVGYALDMKPAGFGLIKLGMYASAVAVDLLDDALALVLTEYQEPSGNLLPPDTASAIDADGLNLYEWNAAEQSMRYSWRGKLWLNPYPRAWPWVRVRAFDYDDLELQFYADGVLLHQQLVTSDRPFRLPLSIDYNEVDWIAVGTSTVRQVELADDTEELT
jgi:hypothetical protein